MVMLERSILAIVRVVLPAPLSYYSCSSSRRPSFRKGTMTTATMICWEVCLCRRMLLYLLHCCQAHSGFHFSSPSPTAHAANVRAASHGLFSTRSHKTPLARTTLRIASGPRSRVLHLACPRQLRCGVLQAIFLGRRGSESQACLQSHFASRVEAVECIPVEA